MIKCSLFFKKSSKSIDNNTSPNDNPNSTSKKFNFKESKKSFYGISDEEIGFGKWICLELFTQIELTKIKIIEKQAKESSEINSQLLKYIKAGKITRIASVIDDFTPTIINERMLKSLKEAKSKCLTDNS